MATVIPWLDAGLMLRVLVWVSMFWLPASLLASPTVGANKLATGAVHACLIDGGQVKCWGRNDNGQLGDGTFTRRLTPVTVSGISSATALTAGTYHTCAIDGEQVKCWGYNSDGQLGDGSTTRSNTPVTVNGINSAFALESGSDHTCVIDGAQVKCWGFNFFGQLGDGSITSSSTPVTVIGITNAVALAAGGGHTCAIVGGDIKCWGLNDTGELGDGTRTQRSTPVTVSAGGATATIVTAGSSHTCAVFGVEVKCWGKNDFGQLGDGSTTNRTTPVTVSGFGTANTLSVTALAAGFSHTCAIDGAQVKCWGWNDFGQLGDGSTTQRSAPVTASGIANATALDTGDYHTCAIDDSQVKCWGLNNWGQLGDGSTNNSSTPVAVVGGLVAPPPPNPNQPVAPPPQTQTEYSYPSDVIPDAAVETAASGTLDSVTLNVTLNLSLLFPSALSWGQGQFAAGYNVYVAALVPAGRLGLPTATWFMLPAAPLFWTQSAIPMSAYLSNVAQNAVVGIDILQNMDMTQLLNTEFYIGYGLSTEEMLAASRYRGVYIAR